MTPVWQVFDRFPGWCGTGRELGKQVSFRSREGDRARRAILDELGDPLLHLLRNAVDHGIEPLAERRGAARRPKARSCSGGARARQRGDQRERRRPRHRPQEILERAKRDGVVDAHAEALTDDQLLRVWAGRILDAEAVTSVSGRGVGIDVAVTRIRAGGTIEIRAEEGKGTTFIMRLPVTLAIVRALIAGVGAERYALPLTYVAETVEFGVQATTIVEGREASAARPGAAGAPAAAARMTARREAVSIIVLEMGSAAAAS